MSDSGDNAELLELRYKGRKLLLDQIECLAEIERAVADLLLRRRLTPREIASELNLDEGVALRTCQRATMKIEDQLLANPDSIESRLKVER